MFLVDALFVFVALHHLRRVNIPSMLEPLPECWRINQCMFLTGLDLRLSCVISFDTKRKTRTMLQKVIVNHIPPRSESVSQSSCQSVTTVVCCGFMSTCFQLWCGVVFPGAKIFAWYKLPDARIGGSGTWAAVSCRWFPGGAFRPPNSPTGTNLRESSIVHDLLLGLTGTLPHLDNVVLFQC